jgi:uncharacterized membrane protein YgaE (UPF0421/DUF939 family)
MKLIKQWFEMMLKFIKKNKRCNNNTETESLTTNFFKKSNSVSIYQEIDDIFNSNDFYDNKFNIIKLPCLPVNDQMLFQHKVYHYSSNLRYNNGQWEWDNFKFYTIN